MALEHKRFAKQQISLTGSALATAAADKQLFVRVINLLNTSDFAERVILFIGASMSTSNRVYVGLMDPGEWQNLAIEYPWVVQAGESLWASASANNVVNIMLAGAEQTIT